MPRAAAVKTTASAEPGNYPTIKAPKAIAAVEDYVAKSALLKALEDEVKVIRALLLGLAGDAPVVFIGSRTLTVTTVPAMPSSPPRKITKEMVGQELPGRRGREGYQQVRVA